MGYAFILMSITSCKKYLAEKSDASLVTPSTLDDYQGLLDDADVMNIYATPSYMEASTDDYFLLPVTYQNLNQVYLNYYTWQPQEYNFVNDWSKAYLAIYNANLCLDGLNQLTQGGQDQVKYDRVKGAALFFRAYYFTELLWCYAKAYDPNTASQDLGIVLRLNSNFNTPSKRSSVEACYTQALKDAKAAVSLLPDHSIHPLRPSKAAAYGLLARIHLSMRQYDQAYLDADSCLQISHDLLDYNNASDLNGQLTDANPFIRFNKESIFYTEMNSNGLIVSSRAKTDSLLYNTFENHDLRKVAFFKPNSGYQEFKGNYTGSPNAFFSGIGVDEMLLTRAECAARAGEVTNAMSDLNTLLRTRWDKQYPYQERTAANPEEALQMILLERRKELLMRGLRWMDIKRLNKDGANIILKRIVDGKVYTLQANDPFYALPLPTDVIERTGMPQN